MYTNFGPLLFWFLNINTGNQILKNVNIKFRWGFQTEFGHFWHILDDGRNKLKYASFEGVKIT